VSRAISGASKAIIVNLKNQLDEEKYAREKLQSELAELQKTSIQIADTIKRVQNK